MIQKFTVYKARCDGRGGRGSARRASSSYGRKVGFRSARKSKSSRRWKDDFLSEIGRREEEEGFETCDYVVVPLFGKGYFKRCFGFKVEGEVVKGKDQARVAAKGTEESRESKGDGVKEESCEKGVGLSGCEGGEKGAEEEERPAGEEIIEEEKQKKEESQIGPSEKRLVEENNEGDTKTPAIIEKPVEESTVEEEQPKNDIIKKLRNRLKKVSTESKKLNPIPKKLITKTKPGTPAQRRPNKNSIKRFYKGRKRLKTPSIEPEDYTLNVDWNDYERCILYLGHFHFLLNNSQLKFYLPNKNIFLIQKKIEEFSKKLEMVKITSKKFKNFLTKIDSFLYLIERNKLVTRNFSFYAVKLQENMRSIFSTKKDAKRPYYHFLQGKEIEKFQADFNNKNGFRLPRKINLKLPLNGICKKIRARKMKRVDVVLITESVMNNFKEGDGEILGRRASPSKFHSYLSTFKKVEERVSELGFVVGE